MRRITPVLWETLYARTRRVARGGGAVGESLRGHRTAAAVKTSLIATIHGNAGARPNNSMVAKRVRSTRAGDTRAGDTRAVQGTQRRPGNTSGGRRRPERTPSPVCTSVAGGAVVFETARYRSR